MGEVTHIQWTDHTHNGWIGCEKISPGCKHCYAAESTPARVSKKRGLPLWGPDSVRRIAAESTWAAPLRWYRAAVGERRRARVFALSLGDVFEDRPELEAARGRLFDLIDATRGTLAGGGLDWQLVTKRTGNARRMLPAAWRASLPWNVWLGATVEDQLRAEERIDELLELRAVVRFLSCEPLLEELRLERWLRRGGLHWLIVGGESGEHARVCDVSWIRSVRDQGRAARVPVFVKQFGALAYDSNVNLSDYADEAVFTQPPPGVPDGAAACGLRLRHPKGGAREEWPEDLDVQELPTPNVMPCSTGGAQCACDVCRLEA